MTKKQLIFIKGTKEGLVLRLDDQCSYAELLDELTKKVSDEGFEGQAEVLLHLGYRYCNDEQTKEIISCVQQTEHLRVTKIQSEVMTVEDCNRRLLENQSETYVGIVRSGQVITALGDLVVVGDVNPNGRVVAGGNIFVLGRLKGIAHAGSSGNKDAVIAASWLEATHLIIDSVVETMTDELTVLSEQPEMECAYLHTNGSIAIDRLQDLRLLRPNLSTFKGGS
ncbi:septum site-determining protein MinC [Paenisporosarcina quisquiliarum]|uniref:Probable septum site-determining protein MinC n=1 Tax=Psychrobacillus psychrodurans TaxID=126157 RepID=A0A9X3LBK6_9BACI|nr:septum site-determining protein MinC [Psychrobacillus psychrodurans]SEM51070.1 septum site-determining protein MinC [Paenisporosarcina quisquiliarum]MCK1996554.1 septum site-determining protein MinC [Psychrobacillus psychrodurans]MCZ8534997.1 septum site-determining protein MinC [Psychrobacillus psychrodurans]MCZ8542127.1 septum site-determining protein MinC [Psychrobacillus psychrodurans]SFN17636.1 septum site-determining protein MinC [Psychrobacillus psychrodurans]